MKVFSILLVIVVPTCAFPALAQTCPPTSRCSGIYQYDGMGNIRAIGSDTYIYDTAGRLVSGTADVQRTGVMSRQDYGYDAFGNRTSASRALGSVDCLGGCEQSLSVDPATNHITSNGAVYDAAGNLISITNTVNGTSFTSTYDYDATGSMTRATAGSGDDRQFIYTADGERIAVKNGQSWTWTVRSLDGKVLREFTSTEQNGLPTANWQWAKDYIWRDGLLLATVAPTTPGASTTVTRHFHLDHLGTPRLVTDDNGVQTGIHAYYSFGAELNLAPNEQPSELMKFTGHERDLLASNPNTPDYMHARYYSASVGRFLSVDPALAKSAMRSPQMWNRYTYAANNPMNGTDPTGKDIVLQGCQNGGGNSQACKDQTAIAQQAFGRAWSGVNNTNGVLTLKSGVSPAMLGSQFGVSARALGFMANSKDHFNMITGPVAAAMAKDFGGGRTVANAGGGANIYIDTARFPQTLGMANMGAAEVFVHETGHAIEPYFASIQAINAKYGMVQPTAKESFSVFLENAYRRQELGLPNNDIRMFYKTPGDIRYEGTHLEDIWP